MYEIFAKILEEKGIKAADVTRATGIKSPVFSEWKKGKSKPNTDKMIKIAKSLGVSVEYLMTGKEPEVDILNPETAKTLAQLSKYSGQLLKIASRYDKLNDYNRTVVENFIDMLIENQENEEKPTKKLLVKRQEENKKTS